MMVKTNRLIRVCLDMADSLDEACASDEAAKQVNEFTMKYAKVGYRALTSYLREGIKAIIDLKREYYRAIENVKFAKQSEKYAGEFLEDIFGDSDIDCINDTDKARIRQFVAGIMKEWEEKE